MKKIEKIVSTAFAVLLAFSFVGCKFGEIGVIQPGNSSDGSSQSGHPSDSSSGNEINDNVLYANGKFDYKAVIPVDADSNESFAASELKAFLYKATGKEIEVINESQAVESDKLIYIGDTQSFTQKGLSLDANAGKSDFILKMVGEDIYICGGSSYGTMYGVYEFLNETVGYEAYAQDEIYVESKDKILLSSLNEFHAPSIDWRGIASGPVTNDITASTRMRFQGGSTVFIDDYSTWHNAYNFFPTAQYLETYGEWWYSSTSDPAQLCYSAHGDADMLALMQNTLLEKMKGAVENNIHEGPLPEFITFTHMDNTNWCQCKTCKSIKATYGTDSAVMIQFVNPVAEELNKWLAETYPGNELNIVLFAYYKTEVPPVKQNKDGEWVAIDETVKPHKNVSVMYAPIYADFGVDFYAESNRVYYERMKGWSAITEKMLLWAYSTHFGDYFKFHDSFNSMVSNYKLYEELGVEYLFDQMRYNAKVLTNFEDFKTYLNAKLMWDVNADYNTLKKSFFNQYYGQASAAMENIYDETRLWYAHLTSLGYKNAFGTELPLSKATFPQNTVENFINMFKPAYEAIAPLKTFAPERYQILYDRILKEELAYRHILLEAYSSNMTPQQLASEREFWKTEVLRLGFNKIKEFGAIETVWANW